MSVIDPIHSLFNELSAGLSGIPAEQRQGVEETLHNLLHTVDNLVEANTQSERRLRELVQFAPTAMYEIDFRTGKFTSVNDWMGELTGYSCDELMQMSAFDLLDDEGKLLFRQRIQKWLAGEPPGENVEYRVKAKDGHIIYCVLDVSFTRDENGRPLGASVIGHDVTERKRMEQALADSERKYRELVQHAASAIYEVDFRTLKFTVINDAMVEMSGYSREELLQMSPFDLLDDKGRNLLHERTHFWAEGKKPDDTVEYRIVKKDGGFIDVVLHSTFTWDEQGRPVKVSVIAHDITQRKAMENAIRASEAHLRESREQLRKTQDQLQLALDATQLGMYDHDLLTDNHAWDSKSRALWGIGPDEVITTDRFLSTIQPEDRPATQEKVQRALDPNGDGRYYAEYRVVHSIDHNERWIAATGQAHFDGKKPVRLIGTVMDITARKQAEEMLRKSEERFNKAFRSNPVALAITRFSDGVFLDANESHALLTGCTREEILGHTAIELGLYYDAAERAELVKTLAEQGIVRDHEMLIRRKSGDIITAILSMEKVELNGETCILGSLIDITGRKRMEEALRTSEDRERARAGELQALMDTVPAMIWLTRDPQCREMIGNRYGFEFLRLPSPASLRNSITDETLRLRSYQMMRDGQVIDQKDLPMHYAAATGKPVEGQTLDFVFDDGTTYQVLANVNPLLDSDGQPAGAVGVLVDITNLRRLESERQEAITNMEVQRRLMAQREQDRNAIARDLHDGPIQTLSSTLFHLQMIKEVFPDPALNGELKHVGDEIKRTVQELRDLLNELRPPALIQFGFIRVMRMFLEDFRERFPDIAVDLKITADDRLLSNLAHLTLYRIFQAGINNIIRHANAGQIWVSFSTGPGCYLLEIRDDGRGFEVPNDFSELTRHSHFGLVGMKERAEAIGGEFKVSSAYGKGTRILIQFPCNEKNMK